MQHISFLKRYLALYDKHCPIVQRKHNSSYRQKPWITRGLQNACKKKNKLYRDMKFRTQTAEKQYKVYKNKLTCIMRQAKKDYYNKMLNENKNNLKSTLKILNNVIGNKSVSTKLPNYFTNGNDVIKNMNEVANEFNSFFVSIGPNLANSIERHDGQTDSGCNVGSKVSQSMFLDEVSEDDIRSIVTKCKNKTLFTDFAIF